MNEPARMSTLGSFFEELRRRRVIRVAIVYLVAGWIIIEVASTVLPPLNLPAWSVKLVIVLIALGFPIAVIMGWMFDIGPHGIERDKAVPAIVEAATAKPETPVVAPAQTEALKPVTKSDTDRHTIAVLPFVNMSGDADNEYFSDGISEEILNLLTKLPQLKVSSRTSSFVFKGSKANIRTVADELGVSTVLEGSVRRAGDHVRITAQLIETDTDSHLWSETYDREMKDVFAIQDDIARSIAEALKVALGPKERRALQNVATADPQAYDFYLKGRKYLYAFTTRDFHSAASMFERAIELDPYYALAYAGKADAYSMLYRYGEATLRNLELAEQASRKAIELDPDCAEAQASLGGALYITGKFAEAAQKFETAILINPKVYEPYLWYGRACLTQGDYEKAARLFTRAGDVNPADYQAPSYLGMVYRSMGRDDLAQQAEAHALAIMERHIKLNPDDARALSFGSSAFALQGKREKAIEWAEAALRTRESEPQYLYNISCTFAQLGEAERALDLLERAADLGWGDRAWMENDSDFTSLRDHPRFKAVLERMH
jgi:adenylate cyclase